MSVQSCVVKVLLESECQLQCVDVGSKRTWKLLAKLRGGERQVKWVEESRENLNSVPL